MDLVGECIKDKPSCRAGLVESFRARLIEDAKPVELRSCMHNSAEPKAKSPTTIKLY